MLEANDLQTMSVTAESQVDALLAQRRAVLEQRLASQQEVVLQEANFEAPLEDRISPTSFTGSTLRTSKGSVTSGTLIAEGDSWFDYPFCDIVKVLEDDYVYEVESLAHRGDSMEEMAYTGGQLDEVIRLLEKLNRRDVVPKAILLSGGGNDLAGDDFAMLLNHARSLVAGLSEAILRAVIDERIFSAYYTILVALNKVSMEMIGRRIPVVIHGYDYAVPDGRGFWGGKWFLPGPWLEPGFREKGFKDLGLRKDIVRILIDRFNDMLGSLIELEQFDNVSYLDLRGSLSSGTDYRDWWDNELHPERVGFEKIASRFASLLESLP